MLKVNYLLQVLSDSIDLCTVNLTHCVFNGTAIMEIPRTDSYDLQSDATEKVASQENPERLSTLKEESQHREEKDKGRKNPPLCLHFFFFV